MRRSTRLRSTSSRHRAWNWIISTSAPFVRRHGRRCFSGRHHARLRVLGTTDGLEVMHGDETMLAEALKPAGYVSGCFGKWHNGSNHPSTAHGQGFDEFFGFSGGFFSNYFDPKLEHDGIATPTKGFITDVLADAAMAFIERKRRSRSFATCRSMLATRPCRRRRTCLRNTGHAASRPRTRLFMRWSRISTAT